jgi:hypothetical protein
MGLLKNVVATSIALIVLGSLAATAFGALEDYVPTDPTVAAIWILIPVFATLGIGLAFLKPFLGSKGM